MTVTQEAVHECRVAVEVKQRRLSRQHYERKSCCVRLKAAMCCSTASCDSVSLILTKPCGKKLRTNAFHWAESLIHHNILRRVQMFALWKITTGPELCQAFGLTEPTGTYGRTALIYCNGEPAVELLEIIAPQLAS